MAGRDFDLGDYIMVPERLDAFYTLYPDGRVSSSPPVVVAIEGTVGPDENGDYHQKAQTYIQVTTTVWRTADDPTPCQASAWELFPGKTPYTKESEMMNAETSAVGRALWAVGIEAKRGAASREDVQKAQAVNAAEPAQVRTPPKVDTTADVQQVQILYSELDIPEADRKATSAAILGLEDIATHNDLNRAQLNKIKIALNRKKQSLPTS